MFSEKLKKKKNVFFKYFQQIRRVPFYIAYFSENVNVLAFMFINFIFFFIFFSKKWQIT